jgi:hypothetical protein
MTNTVASATSKLEAALELWYPKLQEWARSGQLRKAAKQALQLDKTPRKLKQIIEALSSGDFRDLPEIVLLPASSMPGTIGAYSKYDRTIYIQRDWLLYACEANLIHTLTEELGHHLDESLNPDDSPGDEGEIFSGLLTNGLTSGQIVGIRKEDDTTRILVSENWIIAEAAFNWPQGIGGIGTEKLRGVASLGEGFIATGLFESDVSFQGTTLSTLSADAFIAKLDQSGNILWAAQSLSIDISEGIRADLLPDGSSVFVGSFGGAASFGASELASNGLQDIFISKVDQSGKFVWATGFGGLTQDQARDVKAFPDGDIVVTGRYNGTVQFGSQTLVSRGSEDTFVTMLDGQGSVLWSTSLGGAGWDNGWAIAGDNSDKSTLVAGLVQGQAAFGGIISNGFIDDIFVSKQDHLGNFLWVTRAGGSDRDGAHDIAILDDGSCIVTGYFAGTASFGNFQNDSFGDRDAFAMKLDSGGSISWVTQLGGTGFDMGQAVAVLPDQSSVVVGEFSGTASFGAVELTSNGAKDAYVARIDSSGNVLWAMNAGGVGDDQGLGVAYQNDGTIVVAGEFSESADIGDSSIVSKGNSDLFFAKLSLQGVWLTAESGSGPGESGSGGSGGTGGNVTFKEEPSNPQPEPTAPSAGRRIFSSNPDEPIIGTDNDDELIPKTSGSYFMTGNLGADKFVFAVAESRTIDNADYITDYSLKEGDRVVLYDQVFGLGKLKFKVAKNKKKLKKFYGKKTNLIFDQSRSQLIVDLNGQGKGLAGGGVIAVFTNEATLTKTSFELIEGVPPSEMLG